MGPPVALVTGWGLAEATAALGWSLRGRGNARSDAWLATLSLLLTFACSFGLALVALSTLGGAAANLLCAVGLAVYIAMSGILLLQGAEGCWRPACYQEPSAPCCLTPAVS